MGGEERKKRRAGERGGEVRLPHSKFLDPPLPAVREGKQLNPNSHVSKHPTETAHHGYLPDTAKCIVQIAN